jgi:hypothetical protein
VRGIFHNPPQPTPRDELLREQRVRFAMSQKLEEIPRKSVVRGPFGTITANGARYRVYRGVVQEPTHTPVVAYYVNQDASVTFLEPA